MPTAAPGFINAPTLLIGYGAYGISEDAHWFETPVGPFDLVQTRALH